jgi:hypothetical protein
VIQSATACQSGVAASLCHRTPGRKRDAVGSLRIEGSEEENQPEFRARSSCPFCQKTPLVRRYYLPYFGRVHVFFLPSHQIMDLDLDWLRHFSFARGPFFDGGDG